MLSNAQRTMFHTFCECINPVLLTQIVPFLPAKQQFGQFASLQAFQAATQRHVSHPAICAAAAAAAVLHACVTA
jgi:hypothetical protein